MAKEKNSKSLVNQVKELKIINLNGTNYVGNLEKIENGFELTDAVECSDNFETTIKNWLKANNLNSLQKLTCEGDGISTVTKDFTEKQLLEIDIIVPKAEYAIKYAVNELQNSKF